MTRKTISISLDEELVGRLDERRGIASMSRYAELLLVRGLVDTGGREKSASRPVIQPPPNHPARVEQEPRRGSLSEVPGFYIREKPPAVSRGRFVIAPPDGE
jgi:hypothetical protein